MYSNIFLCTDGMKKHLLRSNQFKTYFLGVLLPIFESYNDGANSGFYLS